VVGAIWLAATIILALASAGMLAAAEISAAARRRKVKRAATRAWERKGRVI